MGAISRKEFLEALFNDYFRRRDGFIIVRTAKPLTDKVGTRYFPNIEILSKEQYPNDHNVFFGICPRESMKPDAKFIRYMTAFFVGLDLSPDGYSGRSVYFPGHPQAAKATRSFPLRPSIVIESGTGLHLYWLLNEVTEVRDQAAVDRCLAQINAYFQCKSEVRLDALLRLPDTTNYRFGGHGVPCRVKFLNPDFRYDFDQFFDLKLVAPLPDPDEAGGDPVRDRRSFSQNGQERDGGSDERVTDGSEDLRDFISESAAAVRREMDEEAPPEEPAPSPQPKLTVMVTEGMEEGAGPLPYDVATETVDSVVEVLEEENSPAASLDTASMDKLADEIAERVANRITGKVLEVLADKIVAKLALKLAGAANNRRSG